jgi:hypothetical protein
MFRDVGWPRLLVMIGLLAVLGMLFFRARDPATWQWLADKQDRAETADAPLDESPADAAVTEGPTDEDSDQRAQVEEEFQAVTDGALFNQGTDMFAYWRLLLWADHQSFADMWKRAKPAPRYNDFMQFPAKHRGELVRFDLDVIRVLPVDAPPDCPLEVERLYEIWGHTEESKSWPLCVLAARLPDGMPVGEKVLVRARFAGYFVKLNGYRDALAKPRDPLSRAPLFLGRVRPIAVAAAAASAWDASWLAPAGGALLLLFCCAAMCGLRRGRQPAGQRGAPQAARDVNLDQWLRRADAPESETDAATADDELGWDFQMADPNGRCIGMLDARPSGNGHHHGSKPVP